MFNVQIINLSTKTSNTFNDVDSDFIVDEIEKDLASSYEINFLKVGDITTNLNIIVDDVNSLLDLTDAMESLENYYSDDEVNVMTIIANNNHVKDFIEAYENGMKDANFIYNVSECWDKLAEDLHYDEMLYVDIPDDLVGHIDWSSFESNLKMDWYFSDGYFVCE